MKQAKRKGIKGALGVLFALVMILSTVLSPLMGVFGAAGATALAAVGQTPAHGKFITINDDGTYTIELNVTGDADTEVETAANVNVLIIYDESSSMTSNNVTTNPNRNRADYAEDVMHDFIVNLRGYQKQDDPATTEDESANIQVALVGFGPNATTAGTGRATSLIPARASTASSTTASTGRSPARTTTARITARTGRRLCRRLGPC